MGVIGTEILILFLLAILNGIFAMSEVALLSVRRGRLQHRAARGDRRAEAVLELLQDPNNFFSTVQIGVTLVGVLAGAFGGATIAEQLAARLAVYPALAPYAETIGITIVVLGITYLSLVLGELVPKRVALGAPERIATRVVRPMRFLSRIGSPVVRLLSASTDALLWLLRVKPASEPAVTEEEIHAVIRHGAQLGIFHPAEKEVLERVFRLADRRVTSLMTHRLDISWLDTADPPQTNLRKVRETLHSYLPVADGTLDHFRGIVNPKQLLAADWNGETETLRRLLQTPTFVAENAPALRLLESFKQNPTHLALVIDEYGSVQGLVNSHDLLQAIVGELPTPHGLAESPAVRRSDGSWLLDGTIHIQEAKELLQLPELPGERLGAYQTLAGFIIERMGRIPAVSDQFVWNGLRFEVVDMDGHRIDKVLVAPASKAG